MFHKVYKITKISSGEIEIKRRFFYTEASSRENEETLRNLWNEDFYKDNIQSWRVSTPLKISEEWNEDIKEWIYSLKSISGERVDLHHTQIFARTSKGKEIQEDGTDAGFFSSDKLEWLKINIFWPTGKGKEEKHTVTLEP